MRIPTKNRLQQICVALGSLLLVLVIHFGTLSLGTSGLYQSASAQDTASPTPEATESPASSPSATPEATDSPTSSPATPEATTSADTPATPGATNPATNSEDLVEVGMTVLGFDPVKGELEARLEFIPQGKYSQNESTYPNQNFLLTVNSVDKQGSEINFKAGKPMDASSVKFTAIEGDPNGYPFDNHSVEVYMELDALPTENQPGSTSVTSVPLSLKFYGNLPGFDISSTPTKENTSEVVANAVSISRSDTVKFFSIIVMVIMWVLSLLSLLLAIRVVMLGKLPEFGMLGWLTALLFAFPAIRNAQPNVPPVGTFSDFISFFWAEVIVVVALVLLGVCWLRRYSK